MIGDDDVPQIGPRRRGRPAKGSRQREALRGTVVKKYMLLRDDERTAGHIRRIIGQREIPDMAQICFEDSCLTVEWTCD